MSTSPSSPVMPFGRDSQGRNVLLMPYHEDLASQAIGTRLAE